MRLRILRYAQRDNTVVYAVKTTPCWEALLCSFVSTACPPLWHEMKAADWLRRSAQPPTCLHLPFLKSAYRLSELGLVTPLSASPRPPRSVLITLTFLYSFVQRMMHRNSPEGCRVETKYVLLAYFCTSSHSISKTGKLRLSGLAHRNDQSLLRSISTAAIQLLIECRLDKCSKSALSMPKWKISMIILVVLGNLISNVMGRPRDEIESAQTTMLDLVVVRSDM